VSQYACIGVTSGFKKWTPEEDQKLIDAISGGATGLELGNVIVGRTASAAKGRKKSLLKRGVIHE